MTRSIGRIALLTTVFLVLMVTLIRAQPRDDNALRAFLAPPETCPLPCWQGVRPGVTSLEQAMALMREHPWVGEMNFAQRIDALYWRWNDDQPAFVDRDRRGFLSVRADGIISNVMLYTEIPVGDLILLLGQPDAIYSFANNDLIIVYEQESLEVFTRHECPFNVERFWSTPASVRWTASTHSYLVQYYDIRQIDPASPQWLRDSSRCGDGET